MRYLGGKSRIAKQLAAIVNAARPPSWPVWDAFCGGLSMTRALAAGGPVRSSDANRALISLYAAVAAGWDPPATVSEAEYRAARDLPDTDPQKAFAGFCAGFGGQYFGGYARGEGRNWAAEGRRALLRDCPGRLFAHVDFLAVEPRRLDAVLYCDPPYRGTKSYPGAPAFDHDLFERRVHAWARWQPVFVSEYAFPLGQEVFSAPLRKRATVGPGAMATERLFLISP